mgnify:CR=1 FL=1
MSPNTEWFIDSWSNTTTHRTVELWSTQGNGRRVAVLEANRETDAWLETHEYSPMELFSFTTTDGQRLDGALLAAQIAVLILMRRGCVHTASIILVGAILLHFGRHVRSD